MKCMKKILSDVKGDLNKLTDLFLENNIDTNSKNILLGFSILPKFMSFLNPQVWFYREIGPLKM